MQFKFPCKMYVNEKSMSKREVIDYYFTVFVAELMGTAMLVCFGCASLISSVYAPMQHTHNLVCMIWGITVGLIVCVLAPISHCHINPSVTICFFLLGKISFPIIFVYIIAQYIGSAVGFLMLTTITPKKFWEHESSHGMPFCVCAINPGLTPFQALLWEMLGSSLLIIVVCGCVGPRPFHNPSSFPVKFSLTIYLCAVLTAPFSGSALNSARAFGPAVVQNAWKNHWIHVVGSNGVSVLVTIFYIIFFFPTNYQQAQNAEA